MSAFDWDPANISHVGDHGLRSAEVEQALSDPANAWRGLAVVDGEWRATIIGATMGGRILVVVVTTRGDQLRVVTAYPASQREQRIYQEGQS